MRTALLATALLAGCAHAPASDAGWRLQVSATAGAAIARPVLDSRGRPQDQDLVRIACRRDPAELHVTTALPGGSQAPLRLELGTAAFELAPRPEPDYAPAVAPLTEAVAAALAAAPSVRVGQAGAALGPFPAPDAETRAAFAAACRAALR